MTLQSFQLELARALADDLHTRQWHNYVNYAIIGMILLITIAIFVSTFAVAPWMTTMLWAFAQYIGDPGHFAETPPVITLQPIGL